MPQSKSMTIPNFDPNKPFEKGDTSDTVWQNGYEYKTSAFEKQSDQPPPFDPNKPYEQSDRPGHVWQGNYEYKNEYGIEGPKQESDIFDQPADLSGRFAMKAFGTDVASKVKYYQEKNPDKEVMQNPYKPDEIIARVRGTSKWLKEDPGLGAWLEYPSEIVSDITDLAYDVPATTAAGIATAKGAIFGTAVAPSLGPAAPVAPFLGAVGAGTAASQATEKLRQSIGEKFFGQTQQMPGTLETGALQALGIGLFGPGASKKALTELAAESPAVAKRALEKAAKYFLPKGQMATPEEAKMAGEYLAETLTQRGLVSKAGGTVLPTWFGGDQLNIKTAMENVPNDTVNKLITEGIQLDPNKTYTYRELSRAIELQGGGKTAGTIAVQEITNARREAKQRLGQRYDEALSEVTDTFNVDRYKKPLLDRLNQLQKDKSKASIDEAENIKAILGEYFTPKDEVALVPKTVMENVGGLVDEAGNPIMRPKYQVVQTTVPGSKEWDARSIQDLATRLKDLEDPRMSFAKLKDKTVTSKKDRGAILTTAKQISDDLYNAIPDEKLRSDYRKFAELEDNIMRPFKDETTAAKTLSNAYNKSATQKALLKDIKQFDKSLGTNLEPLAKLSWVGKRFGDPALEQISGEAATSTGRFLRPMQVGTGIGSAAGGLTFGPVGAVVGGGVGGAVGGLSATNAVLNSLLAGGEMIGRSPLGRVQRGIQESPFIYPQQVIPQTWLEMQREKERKK